MNSTDLIFLINDTYNECREELFDVYTVYKKYLEQEIPFKEIKEKKIYTFAKADLIEKLNEVIGKEQKPLIEHFEKIDIMANMMIDTYIFDRIGNPELDGVDIDDNDVHDALKICRAYSYHETLIDRSSRIFLEAQLAEQLGDKYKYNCLKAENDIIHAQLSHSLITNKYVNNVEDSVDFFGKWIEFCIDKKYESLASIIGSGALKEAIQKTNDKNFNDIDFSNLDDILRYANISREN